MIFFYNLWARNVEAAYYLQKEADITPEITFQSLPCRTGSSCCLITCVNRLALWYHINWKNTLSGSVSVLLLELLLSGTCITDLGTNIDVAGACKRIKQI